MPNHSSNIKKINHDINLLLPLNLRWIGWVLATGAIATLVFISSMDVAKKERVRGVLHSASDAVPVQSPVEGVVDNIYIKEGDVVEKGQPLFSVSQQSYSNHQGLSLEDEAISRQETILKEKEATRSTLGEKQLQTKYSIQNKMNGLREQSSGIESQIQTAQSRLRIAQEQYNKMNKQSSAISEIELSRQQDNVLALKQQIDELTGQRIKINSDLSSLNSEFNTLDFTQNKERQELDDEIDALKTRLAEFNQKKARIVVAPMSGVIENIQVKLGKSITASQSQMHLVPPHQPLQLTIYAPARSVAFVSNGQLATIRYEDFPYQRFGSYDGIVVRVGRSAIMPGETAKMAITEPSYEIDIELNAQFVTSYGKQFDLKSGMVADVDITTEKRSLVYWLFEPVLSIQTKF